MTIRDWISDRNKSRLTREGGYPAAKIAFYYFIKLGLVIWYSCTEGRYSCFTVPIAMRLWAKKRPIPGHWLSVRHAPAFCGLTFSRRSTDRCRWVRPVRPCRWIKMRVAFITPVKRPSFHVRLAVDFCVRCVMSHSTASTCVRCALKKGGSSAKSKIWKIIAPVMIPLHCWWLRFQYWYIGLRFLRHPL